LAFDDADVEEVEVEETLGEESCICIRKLAVRTNCPTAAEKPERNALKGYITQSSATSRVG
jgi:hypothetical protein